jgi:hypothetical protein
MCSEYVRLLVERCITGELGTLCFEDGILDCAQVSAAGLRLRFELWYDADGPTIHGPVVYDLRRVALL